MTAPPPADTPPPTSPTVSGRPATSAFVAFRRRHHTPYHRYARTRVEDRRADTAVDDAFAELAECWDEIMRSANPAGHAWRVLHAAVAAADTGPPQAPETARDTLHRTLPPDQADAVVLHYRLGMTLTTAADLMGLEVPAVALHLIMAERALPAAAIRDLERTPAP
ncbi:sigma factor-like helix-turn-helix DNA-binding protein [Embleya sp. NPDC059237]|uniref:sigma factor-like helix-turn-helix DNA-binding protein n=1 Tax=Embleya sp. NPDC059237 TaxID=3346784 RepID=UPI0036925342